MLIFDQAIKARNAGLDDVGGWGAAAGDTPSILSGGPSKKLSWPAHPAGSLLANIPGPSYGRDIGSQLDQALAELIYADPFDGWGVALIGSLCAARADELGGAWNVGTDIRQEFERVAS